MSTTPVEPRNPFEPDNFRSGGGLWDGKTVTVVGAVTKVHLMARKDGTPVLNDNGTQAYKNVLCITGLADDEERERDEMYSAGMLLPSADGLGFTHPQGKEVTFASNSEIAKFALGLKNGGFDVKLLFPGGKLNVKGLIGARLVMKGEDRHDREGKTKKNTKGYTEQSFWPVKFVGFKEGVSGAAPAGPSPELRAKIIENVTALLGENAGTLSRADMVRKLSARLAKDPDANKAIALVSREDFHKDVPWVRDGTTYTLVG